MLQACPHPIVLEDGLVNPLLQDAITLNNLSERACPAGLRHRTITGFMHPVMAQ